MSVSILIPAFRPTFLRQAIASVLTQAMDDFELLVSDDSGGGEVRAVVERFADPRIRYLATAGRTGAINNIRSLWEQAHYDRLKYLFDDDLLMPTALVELLAQADRVPQASMVFGQRITIDSQGRQTAAPTPFSPSPALLNAEGVAAAIVGPVQNGIGEFSNILINRAVGLTPADFISYMGFDLRVVGDVAFYLNASRRGPVVGVARVVGAFRRHENQNSSASFNPDFALGACEWEIFVRGEYAAGRLAPERALAAVRKLDAAYGAWALNYPDIALLQPGLRTLAERIAEGEREVLDDSFRDAWAELVAALDVRKAR